MTEQTETFKTATGQSVPLDCIVMPPTLMQGDCLKLMFDIPDNSVDMVCCDMPYGTTACKWDTVLPLDMLWHHYSRIVKKNGAIVLFSNSYFTMRLANSNMQGFCYSWVWDKKFAGNFVQAKRMPLRAHEDVLVFSKDGTMPMYYPQKTMRDKPIKKGGNKQSQAIPICQSENAITFGKQSKEYNDKYPDTLLKFSSRDEQRGFHPTQKPVSLCEYLIRTYTKEGQTVLDNCMGSGTTGIACLNTGRNFIGIEKDQKYFEIARSRIMGPNAVLSGKPPHEEL